MPGVASASGSGIWSRRRDEITFDRLQKFWNDLTPQARQELLKLDKQTFIEQVRKNFYCSRCNGLLLECFTQIVMYGKSLQQETPEDDRLSTTADSKIQEDKQDVAQDLPGYPWGGLLTAKDGTITLLDYFVKAKSLNVLQNVFDNAQAREREREMLYPDACGAFGRGWISQGMASYSRGHGTRELCALHTADLSCDTLVDFWSALGEQTRYSLLRMKEEDFIEKLMYRFDDKRFCRDCRRNVIREFKELKELKRMRWEPRCTNWFCIADTAFQCEVFEDAVVVDWSQYLSAKFVSYDHFEWAIGTDEGESDVFGFEDVGINAQVHRSGINLDEFEDYFITLRAWKLDGECNEFCVKAHALKGQSCVHHRLVVGDGFVTITQGESIRSFFEHAEEAEEEDEDDAMDRDGNDLDGGFHPQKHAKSPELAREFLLDAVAIIFKEQVEKAFREGTARQNAYSVFTSLSLKLLEERVHVACKEIITLEKQNKLLEEEEKEKHEVQERRIKRRTKEREKKLRRKQKLKEKGNDKGKRLVQFKSPDKISSSALSNTSISTNDESTSTLDSRDSASEEEDNTNICVDRSSCWEINGENNAEHCNVMTEYSQMDSTDCWTSEQSRSRRSPSLKKDFSQVQPFCYDDSQNESGRKSDFQWQSKERTKNRGGNCNLVSTTNNRIRDRHMYNSCSRHEQADCRDMISGFLSTDRSGREMKMARKAGFEKSGVQYRRHYPLNNFIAPKESHICSTQKNAISKQVWEPLDVRKKNNFEKDNASSTIDNASPLKPMDCDAGGCQNISAGSEAVSLSSESFSNLAKSETDQPFENGTVVEASSCGITPTTNKKDCNSTNEVSRRDDLMKDSVSPDSSSSCISDGDGESSSSILTSSSTRNQDLSSDSEESSSNSVNSIPNAPSLGTALRSLLETCAGKGFREYQPKATRLFLEGNLFNTSQVQDPLLHHQNLSSSATTGIQNQSWATPTNGNFQYARPSHFPSSFVVGIPGNQFIDYPVQFSNVNPYLTFGFRHAPPVIVPKTETSFSVMPQSPHPFQNGGQHIAGHLHRDINLGHCSKPKSTGQMDFLEDRNKLQDADASFSLFQFNLPIASPVLPSSTDGKSGDFAEKTSLAQVEAHVCSREQTDVKEYNLFSTKDSGIFSFMQIN